MGLNIVPHTRRWRYRIETACGVATLALAIQRYGVEIALQRTALGRDVVESILRQAYNLRNLQRPDVIAPIRPRSMLCM